jgi:hypothetical protein
LIEFVFCFFALFFLKLKSATFSFRGNVHSFDDAAGGSNDARIPFFTADITLAIPNVV